MGRFSKKRQAIYDCLCATASHPTADWIYQTLRPTYPDLSLGTVYRNLSQLKASGLIRSVGVVNGQERFDGIVTPHPHLVCQCCGSVQDLMDIPIPENLISDAMRQSGCYISDVQLCFTGLCPSCRKKAIS